MGLSVVASVIRRLGSERRLELVCSHRSGPRSVGALDAKGFGMDTNGFGTTVGFDLGRLKTRKRTALGPWTVGDLNVNGVGTSVGFCQRQRWSNVVGTLFRLSVGEPRLQTASGCRQ